MNHADLPKRRSQVLCCIRDFMASEGFPPSLKEVADAIGLKSDTAVKYHLKELEKGGYVRVRHGIARGITLTDLGRAA